MSLYSVEIRGKHHLWSMHCELSQEAIDDLREAGYNISKLENIIPDWVPSNLIYHYCFLQDLFNFKVPKWISK